jgi:hypothetical protein
MALRSLFTLAAKIKPVRLATNPKPPTDVFSRFLLAVKLKTQPEVEPYVSVSVRPEVDSFAMTAWRGDVEGLRNHVLAGQNLNEVGSLKITALRCAVLSGEAGAVRFLLQEGADPQQTSMFQDALGTAERMVTLRKRELEGRGHSWKVANPNHVDSKLKALSECVELLKNPAKAFETAPEMETPGKDEKGRGWNWM